MNMIEEENGIYYLKSSIYLIDGSVSVDCVLAYIRQALGCTIIFVDGSFYIKATGSEDQMNYLKKKFRRLSRGHLGFKIDRSMEWC